MGRNNNPHWSQHYGEHTWWRDGVQWRTRWSAEHGTERIDPALGGPLQTPEKDWYGCRMVENIAQHRIIRTAIFAYLRQSGTGNVVQKIVYDAQEDLTAAIAAGRDIDAENRTRAALTSRLVRRLNDISWLCLAESDWRIPTDLVAIERAIADADQRIAGLEAANAERKARDLARAVERFGATPAV